MKQIKSTLVIALFFLASLYPSFSAHKWEYKDVLKYDVSGYYLFLPAAFIYNDLGKLSFYTHIDSVYQPSGEIKNYAQYEHPETGMRSNKYPIGVALAELPLFIVAHIYATNHSDTYSPDGYSLPYQLSVAMSNILWSVLGLLVLRAFLRRHYNDTITAITILLIGFGTNFFCYTGYDMGMSHTLVFFLFSCVLYFTDKWYALPKIKYAFGLGLFLGWTAIARPVDIVIILLPLLWPLADPAKGNRLQFWLKYRTHLLVCIVGFFLLVSLQLGYWKYVTDHFIHFSYEEEGFMFSDPEILKGLFGFRKGWFIYTPIAFWGCIGLIPLLYQHKRMALVLMLFLAAIIYIVFSWSCWWYGWSFGCRALVESLAVVSIPLAALVRWFGSRKLLLKGLGIAAGLFFTWLNLYQTEQYKMGAIHGDNMNYKFYWRVWNKMHPSEKDWKYFNK